MKTTGIEPVIVQVNRRGDWLFVLVHTDAGISGLGEASLPEWQSIPRAVDS